MHGVTQHGGRAGCMLPADQHLCELEQSGPQAGPMLQPPCSASEPCHAINLSMVHALCSTKQLSCSQIVHGDAAEDDCVPSNKLPSTPGQGCAEHMTLSDQDDDDMAHTAALRVNM